MTVDTTRPSPVDRISAVSTGHAEADEIAKLLRHESDEDATLIADILEDSSDAETMLFFALRRAVESQFDNWVALVKPAEYRIGIFIATVLGVCCAFLDEDERLSKTLIDGVILLVLSTRRDSDVILSDFKPDITRGAMIERIITGGNEVGPDGRPLAHLRWLDQNYCAISRYSSVLRERTTIDRGFIETLLASPYPEALDVGVL